MKKLFVFTLVSISLTVFACKKKDFPLSPGTGVGSGSASEEHPRVASAYDWSGDQEFNDYDPDKADVQDVIFVEFSEPMNPNTITEYASISIVGGKGVSISGTWVYEVDRNRLKFTPEPGFADSTKYLVTISNSAQDREGQKLDGNGNTVYEGSLDDYHITFWTDNGNFVPEPDFDPPQLIAIISPDPGSFAGSVYVKDSLILLFYGDDINNTTVPSGIKLYEYETNASVTLGTPTITKDTILGTTRVAFGGFTLNFSTVYTLEINTNLRDSAGNSFDGNGNGYSEIDRIDRYIAYFATEKDTSNNPTEYPEVSGNPTRTNNVIYVRFNTEMDDSTFISSNIEVFSNPNRTGFIETILRTDIDNKGFQLTLIGWDGTLPVYLFLSKELKDKDGDKFDGNENGIGGMFDDDRLFWIN